MLQLRLHQLYPILPRRLQRRFHYRQLLAHEHRLAHLLLDRHVPHPGGRPSRHPQRPRPPTQPGRHLQQRLEARSPRPARPVRHLHDRLPRPLHLGLPVGHRRI